MTYQPEENLPFNRRTGRTYAQILTAEPNSIFVVFHRQVQRYLEQDSVLAKRINNDVRIMTVHDIIAGIHRGTDKIIILDHFVYEAADDIVLLIKAVANHNKLVRFNRLSQLTR